MRRLTILGCQAPFPTAGGACSGYLVSNDNEHVLIDCGSGVIANLSKVVDFRKPDFKAVILSHLHHDHISDLWLLRYGASYAAKQGWRKALPVYSLDVPQKLHEMLDYDGIEQRGLAAGHQLELLGAKWSFFQVRHPLPCLGVRIEWQDYTLVFTGDTSFFPELVHSCQRADLLLAECSLAAKDVSLRSRGHMTSWDAGQLAQEASVGRLVLTHFWPDHDAEQLAIEASTKCSCPIEVAQVGKIFELRGHWQ